MENSDVINLSLLSIILILNVACLIFELLLKKNNDRRKNEIIIPNITIKEVMDDLNYLINYKCNNALQKILIPFKNKKLGNSDSLISDEVLNEITTQISKEIISELSLGYKKKLCLILEENILEDVILSLVYDNLSNIVIQLNKDSIKKFYK